MTPDNSSALLCSAYLPPVQYISKFLMCNNIWIEAFENFSKQTYRNRSYILSANGVEALTVPIVKGNSKQLIKDVQIAYDMPWQHTHWNAIVSAYNSTPFFEILADDFRPFFEKKYSYLLDLNLDMLNKILNILEIEDKQIQLTKDFELFTPEGLNLRDAMHPKVQKAKEDIHFSAQPYSQMFDHKFDFQPNLSIIDLLFNCGSASYEMILKSCK
ncbi:MAG: WbqC family protein [Mangrovibacterium sp.]